VSKRPSCAAAGSSGGMSTRGLVSRVSPVQTALRNCTRDEGRSFEVGNQVLISSHRKLLSSERWPVACAMQHRVLLWVQNRRLPHRNRAAGSPQSADIHVVKAIASGIQFTAPSANRGRLDGSARAGSLFTPTSKKNALCDWYHIFYVRAALLCSQRREARRV
jgi:hypothetical protein